MLRDEGTRRSMTWGNLAAHLLAKFRQVRRKCKAVNDEQQQERLTISKHHTCYVATQIPSAWTVYGLYSEALSWQNYRWLSRFVRLTPRYLIKTCFRRDSSCGIGVFPINSVS